MKVSSINQKRPAGSGTLARDLALGLVAALAMVMLVVGVGVYLVLADRAGHQFDRISGEIAANLARVLSVPVAQGNRESIDNTVRAYIGSRTVAEIQVHDANGKLIFRDKQGEETRARVLKLPVVRAGRRVGSLVVSFSMAELDSMRMRFMIALSVLAACVILAIFVTTRILIGRLLGRPLNSLLLGINEIAGGRYDLRLNHVRHSDINTTIDAVNRMARKIEERSRLLENSEAKYRRLVEGSREIIFALDDRGGIFTVNQAIAEHLGYQPRELLGKSFPDMAYQAGPSSGFIVPELIRERLREVIASKGTAELNVEMATRIGEPYELNIRLEYVALEGAHVIHGRAAPAAENTLTRHCETEKQTYVIGNNLILAELLNQRITAALPRYMGSDQVMPVRLGLREMLINSIEHGNLNITFEEKSEATMDGSLMALIQERRDDERYRDRRIVVEYFRDESRVEYVITDQGQGFDHRLFGNRDIRAEGERSRMHGRGIALARMTFDRVEYNEVGNQVKLVKYFQSERVKG